VSSEESEECGSKVLDVLKRSGETLSAKELIERLKAEGNETEEGSVFRALFFLAKSGSVERLPGKGGPALYRATDKTDAPAASGKKE